MKIDWTIKFAAALFAAYIGVMIAAGRDLASNRSLETGECCEDN